MTGSFIHWSNDPRLEAAGGDSLTAAKAMVECGMMRPDALIGLASFIDEVGVGTVLDAWWSSHDPTGVERNVLPVGRSFRRGHSVYEHPSAVEALQSIY